MRAFATVLTVLLFLAILTVWVPGRWALSLLQAGVSILAIAWIAPAALGKRRTRFHALMVPLGGAVLWAGVQLAAGTTAYRWNTWESALNWAVNFLLFFLAFQFFQERSLRRGWLNAVLWFGAALSAVALAQVFTSHGKVFWLFPSGYPDGVLGPFVSHGHYSAFLEMLLPVALWRALRRPREAWLYGAVAAVMYASVIASASRMGFVLATAEVPAVFLLARIHGAAPARGFGPLAGKLLLAVVAGAALGAPGFLWNRLRQPDPFSVRREATLSSLAMVRERPWTGFGLGCWPVVYPRFALFDDGFYVNQAHNDWAQWAAEGGLPFLGLMLALAGLALRPALASVWGAGLVAVLLHALVDYPMQQRPAVAGWFFVLLGAAAARRSARRETHADELLRRAGARPVCVG